MAESQVPWSYDTTGSNLIASLSETRFKSYLLGAGQDRDYAFGLYLYNARMAKAFLYPLHVLEITLRNRINDIFCHQFCAEWCHDKCFRQILSAESLATLDRALKRAKSRQTADIIATLSFDFWSNLFRSEYDRPLWQTKMEELLPNEVKTRSEFQKEIKKVNDFRNRIAHHEPVYKMDLSQIHSDLLSMLSWLSGDVYQWVKHFSTVNNCLRSRPSSKKINAPCISEKADSDYRIVNISDAINSPCPEKFIICIKDADIHSVIELQHLAKYLLSHQEKGELVLNLEQHTFAHVTSHCCTKGNFTLCSPDKNLYLATKELKGKIHYLVVGNQGNIQGVVARAHRRY